MRLIVHLRDRAGCAPQQSGSGAMPQLSGLSRCSNSWGGSSAANHARQGRAFSPPCVPCSALHAQGNKLLLYRRSNSGTTALYIPGTTPHPNGFPRRKVGRIVCIPTSSSPPIRWRRLRQHRSTTKPNKSSQASPGRVELVQFSSALMARRGCRRRHPRRWRVVAVSVRRVVASRFRANCQ